MELCRLGLSSAKLRVLFLYVCNQWILVLIVHSTPCSSIYEVPSELYTGEQILNILLNRRIRISAIQSHVVFERKDSGFSVAAVDIKR